MFPNEVAAKNAYQELLKIFTSMEGTLEPTSSDEILVHDYVGQLRKKVARQQRKVILQRKLNKRVSRQPISSDEMWLRDYVPQFEKKLARQWRKIILQSKLNKRMLRVQRSNDCLNLCSDAYIPSNSDVTYCLNHASENKIGLLLAEHHNTMHDERRACNAISSQKVALDVEDPNLLRIICEKHVLESYGCEKDLDAICSNPNQLETLCQMCGVTGYNELLIFCVNCQIFAVHRYCLHKLPENNEVEVTWLCEQCTQRLTHSCRELSGNSLHLTEENKNLDLCSKMSKVGKEIEKHRQRSIQVVQDVQPLKIVQICTDQNSFNGIAINTKNAQDHAVFRLCDVSAARLVYQVTAHIPYDCGPPNSLCHQQPLLKYDAYVHPQPIIDPTWRGCFDVCNCKYGMIVGHLSNQACFKVHEGARMLPPVLCAEKLPRMDSWPEAFRRSRPTDENIGLYFFPEGRRDEKVFHQLLCDINSHDLALKIAFDEADLLVLSSLLLPQQLWRFRGNFYLWGVFKGRKAPLLHEKDDVRHPV